MAVSAFHNDRNGEPSDVQCDLHSRHPLSEVVAKTAFHFVTEQRLILHCIMQGKFCQKIPGPWVYGNVPPEGLSFLYIIRYMRFRRGVSPERAAAGGAPAAGGAFCPGTHPMFGRAPSIGRGRSERRRLPKVREAAGRLKKRQLFQGILRHI